MPLLNATGNHLKLYGDLLRLFVKYGRSDLVRHAGLEEEAALTPESEAKMGDLARDLTHDLEQLGPTFIKLGQVLSTRADLLPFNVLDALSRLQDHVGPFPFEQVRETIESELGAKLNKLFTSFDVEPVAAASLGQVHRAELPSGRWVAVKVQRSGVRERVAEDFEVLQRVAGLLDEHTEAGRTYEFGSMLKDAHQTLLRELDYEEEARHLRLIRRNLKDFKLILIPEPVNDYSTSRVLTMDYVHGRKVTQIGSLRRLDLDGEALLDELFRAYLHQILVDGFFHADPHPGNIFLTDQNEIALFDLGMVCKVSPSRQDMVLKLMLTISEGRGEEAAQAVLDMSQTREDFNPADFHARVAEQITNTTGSQLSGFQMGGMVMTLQKIAAETGVRFPRELRFIGKVLYSLEGVGAVLDPEFDPARAIRRHAADIMQRRLLKSLSPSHVFQNMVEMKQLIEQIPRNLNHLIQTLANNEFEVKVDALDEQRLMVGFQKVANRITVGLVLAAMIVGAALLMRVPTRFMLFGYPGLAMLFFLFAAAIGGYLVLTILWSDDRERKK